jgi:hypothetical protein
MRVKQSDQVFSSEKNAQEVSTCIAKNWGSWVNRFEDWGVVKPIEIPDGYSISALKYGPDPDTGTNIMPTTINYLVDVDNKSTGNVTKLYQYLSLNLGDNPFVAAAQKCQ